MKVVRSRRAALVASAIGFAGGAIAFGLIPASSASQNVVPNPVTVTNGATDPVPVSGNVAVNGTVGIDQTNNGMTVTNFPASQNVNGTVDVGNLPATQPVSGSVSVNNLPAVQNVSGSVGLDPANNHVQVDNLPATQNVAGTVNVGNLPATQNVAGTVGIDPANNQVQVSTTTKVLDEQVNEWFFKVGSKGFNLYPSGGFVDSSPYKTVTVVLQVSGANCTGAVVQVTGRGNAGYPGITYPLETIAMSQDGSWVVKTYTDPPPGLSLILSDGGNTNFDCFLEELTYGRAN
jgi:hypothetical protein